MRLVAFSGRRGGGRIPKLDGRLEGDSDWFLIAEVGVNHENDMEKAKMMIEQCAGGGAKAVKFQTYKAGMLAIRDSPAYWDTSKEPAQNQFELFSRFDKFGQEEYEELARYCVEFGVEFMSTAFDLESLEYIDPLVKMHKIASADLTNVPLLRAVAKKSKPVLLSTGAASLGEIGGALEELVGNGATEVVLLHCVLNYPTPDENAFLGRIANLSSEFPDVLIGYSDHTVPDSESLACIEGYCLGARVFEKHFTFDKSLPGNDHYHAMDYNDLGRLVSRLNQTASMIRSPSDDEFLAAQESAIVNARRSIVTSRAVEKGETLTGDSLTTKRPGSGLSPKEWDSVIGRVAKKGLPSDHQISFDELE